MKSGDFTVAEGHGHPLVFEKRQRGNFLLPRGFNVCLDISFEEN
jgi:hypothetical protein